MAECIICSQSDRLERIEDKLDSLHKKLFEGNGTPSLASTVAVNSNRITTLENAPIRTQTTWQTWATVGAVVVALVSLLIGFYHK